jgi:hypothetical protein
VTRVTLILLGPQNHRPVFGALLERFGGGPVAVISAGWQEDEGEVEELAGRSDLVDLHLYRRAEELFAADPALFRAHRERQTRLQELQRLYRLRLGHALDGLRALDNATADPRLLATERRAALAALRTLDRHHLRQIRRQHQRFNQRWSPARHGGLAAQRAELAGIIAASAAVLLTGGHVALLMARLRLFDLGPLLADKPLIAWSAGAMALTERIVVFHDNPPQGSNDPELLDQGLGLVRQIVCLPHARHRLRLDDRDRVAVFAARFAPARCVTLDEGARLIWQVGRLAETRGSFSLTRRGRLVALEAEDAPALA